MSLSRIYSVDLVGLSLIKTDSPGLIASVSGRVTSTGWSDLKLLPWVYLAPPADRIQDMDAVAEPPKPGITTLPVPSPIHGDMVISPIDIANYWGPDIALKGVRCHSVGNVKVALFEEIQGMQGARIVEGANLAAYTAVPEAGPSFEADIKPKFRPNDVAVMKAISGFDLHIYDDVSANADRIFQRINDRTMPCDGPWPQADIDLFEQWKDGGKAP